MRRFVLALSNFTNKTSEWITLAVLAIFAVTMYEVLARWLFDKPTAWAHEVSSLLFGVYVILLGAYCLLREQHVRVDILWSRLSSRGKAIADLATSLLGLLFIGAFLLCAIPWAWESVRIREVSETVFGSPLYPSKILVVVASLWLLVQYIAKCITDFYTATRRQ